MTKLNKLYSQIVNNPKDVNFDEDELDKLLKQQGFNCRQSGKGSSHYIYYHSDLTDLLSIPKARPIKAIYVKRAIAVIERLKERSGA